MSEHVVVVGASLAGLRTVEALRREGFAGQMTVIGAEAEAPYDRPPLSKQFLVDGWEESKLALARDGLEGLDAKWRLGQSVVALDVASRVVRLEGGESIEASAAVVLATGARARRLPFGRDLSGIFELRTLDDARGLREALEEKPRVVVVGAGFIGMELAASCRQKGLEVSVVDPLPAPLVRGLGSVLGERVAVRHREEGVTFHLDVGVDAFVGEGNVEARVEGVRLSDGSTLPADVVIVGVGASPAVEWLEGSGLEIDNGIVCDSNGYTGSPGIFALGDCARWENANYPERPRFEHWTSAVEQADVVAKRIVSGEPVEFAPIPYVWTDQFELRIAIAGEVRDGDEMWIGKGRLEEDRFLALFGREGRLTGAVGFKRPRELNASRRMIAEGVSFAEAVERNA